MSHDHANVVAPPPLIFLGFLLAGLVAHWALGLAPSALPEGLRYGAAALALVLGVVFVAGALGLFRKAGTAARPWKPSTALVTRGVYRVTRNPMYLGMVLICAAIAFACDSMIALAAIIPAVLTIDFGVIRREERYLETLFGDDYRQYKRTVRRWI